ncbi:hypothetical protein ZK41_004880 [Salmonella enterica subsp. enterica serovar Java]|uniref:Uncharacterized protein n=4 Tax=Salmonella enterica TaxID=28901 RepID=A0A5W5WCN0_SALNE|nr:hypothetical protein [Salmonella enterica subsp. enterica serovar Vitkin]EAC0381653.1 hypothetical protein [Salmonella enterica subsp. enterica serovar Potsdam]EAP4496809.1 hypothetical protein [Salmonella enterica]EBF9679731.1 hypothetical protein [Salmonella enterica subsp. enterica serovar Glostrup]EBR0461132.1 hypothetical protein [Salmonella enterica subsp. enterica serovar Abony]EBR9919320.1 hypothetical protein [Salmonella enterica subsp. enterica serovar Richmond]EBS4874941.1 hypot
MAAKYTEKDVLRMRQQNVQRIVDFITQEYPDDEINHAGEALWLAMQMICGPYGAACIVRSSQVC